MNINDRVTVYRRSKKCYWNKDMDIFVGESGTITEVDDEESVQVIFDSFTEGAYHIPISCLKYEQTPSQTIL
jgi:hypothetical protein